MCAFEMNTKQQIKNIAYSAYISLVCMTNVIRIYRPIFTLLTAGIIMCVGKICRKCVNTERAYGGANHIIMLLIDISVLPLQYNYDKWNTFITSSTYFTYKITIQESMKLRSVTNHYFQISANWYVVYARSLKWNRWQSYNQDTYKNIALFWFCTKYRRG